MAARKSPQTTKISFIRHGNVHNPGNIFYGRLPRFRLSEKGEEDAKKAADFLRDTSLAAVFSSPLLRTRQTAAHILTCHPSLRLSISKHLHEVRSYFEGKSQSELNRVAMDVYHHKDSRWEQPEDVLNRTIKYLKKVRRNYCGSQVAAVTHGDVVLFAMFWALGITVTPENKLDLSKISSIPEYPATGSITTLTFYSADMEEMPSLQYVNNRM